MKTSDQIARRLSALKSNSLPPAKDRRTATISVPLTWPNLKNAELEVVERLCVAANNIGSRVIVTDNDGYPLWASDGAPVNKNTRVTRSVVDFNISLHFESPRLTDIYSYYTVWQPLDFYHKFNYEQSILKISTHSDALSCASELCDAHMNNLLGTAKGVDSTEFPYLFHSPPEPYYKPNISADSRLFYVGVNWERVSGTKGRFHELLSMLDREEMVDIYGPQSILGVAPWEGYQCYRGEIPFDGKSVVEAVSRSGICMAFSSQSHAESGIMSNRFFEGLAAGAAVISTPHPIVDKYFKDVVYEIPDTDDDNAVFFALRSIMHQITQDPEEAMRRATEGQNRLRDFFSLEGCLQALINGHNKRYDVQTAKITSPGSISVLLPYDGMDTSELQDTFQALSTQVAVEIELMVVCDEELTKAASLEATGSVKSINYLPYKTDGLGNGGSRSDAIFAALSASTSEYVAIASAKETYFEEHFGTLLKTLSSSPESKVALSDAILEDSVPGSPEKRRRQLLALVENEYTLGDALDWLSGAWLLRRDALAILTRESFRLFSGLEAYCSVYSGLSAGPLARTGRATCLVKSGSRVPALRSHAAKSYASDTFRLAAQSVDTDFLLESLSDSDERRKPAGPDDEMPWLLRLQEIEPIRKGAHGANFLRHGFSNLEESAVWMDGRTAGLGFMLVGDLTDADRANLEIVLEMAGRASQTDGTQQRCAFKVNGETVAYEVLPDSGTHILLQVPSLASGNRFCTIEMTLDHAEPVLSEDGQVLDQRLLGARISSITARRNEGRHFHPLLLGEAYELGLNHNQIELMYFGGLMRDDVLELTDGPAVMRLNLPAKGEMVMASVEIDTSSMRAGETECLRCVVNGLQVGEYAINSTTQTLKFPLVSPYCKDDTSLFTLLFERAGDSGASHAGSIGIKSLRFDTIPECQAGETYSLIKNGAGVPYLGQGFSHPEAEYTWIDGKQADLLIPISAETAENGFELSVSAGARATKGKIPYILEVEFRNTLLGTFELDQHLKSYVMTVPANAVKRGAIELSLRLNCAEVVKDKKGKVLDSRRLGARIAEFVINVDQSTV